MTKFGDSDSSKFRHMKAGQPCPFSFRGSSSPLGPQTPDWTTGAE